MAVQGKGFMIWKITSCENGNAIRIAEEAVRAGLTYVLIKIANGVLPYNINSTTQEDYVPAVTNALHAKGLQVWGWHYLYGNNPKGEALIAVKRVQELGLDGYVIDAEDEYKRPGMDKAATLFMSELRKGIPNKPVALCSFRYPNYHPQLPWKQFLESCDFNMPQVYWQNAHNASAQLRKSVYEFHRLTPYRPIIPTGPVYKASGWVPTTEDITEFLITAKQLNLQSVNFFAWDWGRTILRPLWDTVSAFPWPPYPTPIDIPELYIRSLNTREPALIANLFTPQGVHITADKTVQGTADIREWYRTFLTQTFPNATFKLTGIAGTGDARHFTWQGVSSKGKIDNGNDTIGMVNGQIAYHYSYFTVT